MQDWRSYDDVAETYERVHAHPFREPARDLLALAHVGPGARVLDLGTGTGVAGELALDLVGPTGTVVGVDESVGMLRVAAAARPAVRVGAALAIDLPFRAGAFDAVIGNFVLAHFTKVDTALFDVIRVTTRGGRIGFSAWADGPDAFQETWLELVYSVVPKEMIEPSVADAIPNHERFRRREVVEQTLHDAGLRHVRTELTKYEWRYARDDYVDGLGVWAVGRFVRNMLGEAGWASFMDRAKATFAERFPDPLHDTRDVLLAVGTRLLS
jgi:ubiquinone/menaquinone biosynthesis C-methylase UbiE